MSNDNRKSKATDGFGRDDMMAMLGGDLSETLTRRPLPAAGTSRSRSTKPDISDLTTAETAALLMDQHNKKLEPGKSKKQLAVGRDRHRTRKVRAYHQLLHEEAVRASTSATAEEEGKLASNEAITPSLKEPEEEHDSESDTDERVESSHAQVERTRMEQDSSPSSSDTESAAEGQPSRRRIDSSSSEDDDDEVDARRSRLLAKRRGLADVSRPDHVETDVRTAMERDAPETKPTLLDSSDQWRETESKESRKNFPRAEGSTLKSDDSSSSDESSSSSSSSSSSDDEDSNDAPNLISRPIFIPRHKRSSIPDQVDMKHEEEEHERLRLELQRRRKQESRAMVQQVLAATAQAAPDWSDAFEGITAARNSVPDDSDQVDFEKEREEWEVRELVRLVEDWDIEQESLAQEREIMRRRQLTDDERLQEDIAAGRFKKPGENSHVSDGKPMAKRYYHKGAFYMDEDEFTEDDVRRKATEYARSATGSDKVNTSLLPKIMRVKKFGFANQPKYKGLKAEDTTDRKTEMLPLKRKK